MIRSTIKTLALIGFIGMYLMNSAASNPTKAVFETSEKDGFKVSEIGLKNLDVEIQTLAQSQEFKLPASSLVYLKDKVGVYRHRNGWFKLIFVSHERISSGEIIVRSSELNTGDAVVIKGAALLRVAESDAFGGEG